MQIASLAIKILIAISLSLGWSKASFAVLIWDSSYLIEYQF